MRPFLFLVLCSCGNGSNGGIDAGVGAGAPPGTEGESGGGGGGGGGGNIPLGTSCEGLVYQMGGDLDEDGIPARCSSALNADSWSPMGGPRGGISGGGVCGRRTGNCPTTYVAGNVGSACSSDSQCTGLDPVCLRDAAYGGGTCSSRGCEVGSNLGCPAGDTCVETSGDTYCLEGCGIAAEGCFVGCPREGFSCFATESKVLGYCLAADAVRQCDPSEGISCTSPSFGDGVCDRTGWDDISVGKCFESCNPIAQDCSRPQDGCYAVRDVEMPICYQNWGRGEGEACTRLTHCARGLSCQCRHDDSSRCAGGKDMECRAYCMPGCDQCPSGQECRKITGWPYGACIP